jgi:hypothetical protein
VRLDFSDLSSAQQSKLFAWAQLSASRSQGWGLAAQASAPWQWVQRQLGGAWHLVASSFAQQPTDR